MNKLEPICRLLAAQYWGHFKLLMKDKSSKNAYVNENWPQFKSEAREIVQAQLEMLNKERHDGVGELAGEWFCSLLKSEDASSKSLGQKMHDAFYSSRKHCKTVRDDE